MALVDMKHMSRNWVVGTIVMLLVACCGVGGLWYEGVRRDRREAAIWQEAARMEACVADCVVPGKTDERESALVIRSAVRMRSTCGSRTPGAVGCEPIVVSSPPRSGERYAAAQENEFRNPRSEPLSTFGLDVDTTSYGLMRSSIADEKRLPAKGSVRIEEFVNYFKYDYPQPTGDEPIAVDCELATCPWNAKHRLLRVGVQAKTVDEANCRRAISRFWWTRRGRWRARAESSW